MNGKLEVQQFDAASLRGNPLGDPSTRKLLVYLPKAHEQGNTALRAVYFLHGFSGSAFR